MIAPQLLVSLLLEAPGVFGTGPSFGALKGFGVGPIAAGSVLVVRY